MKATIYAIVLAMLLAPIASRAQVGTQASTQDSAPSAINVASQGIKKTAQFKIWKSNIEISDKIGSVAFSFFCTGKTDAIYTKGINEYNVSRVNKFFVERSTELGYPKYTGDESAFAEKLGVDADFRLGVTLLALNYDICGSEKAYSGSASVKFKLELFSTKLQKIVYSQTVDGAISLKDKVDIEEFDKKLFINALDKMFADPKYVAQFKDDNASQLVASGQKIDVKNVAKLSGGVLKNSKDILSTVVTIESGLGSGSGFYIGKDGYIFTNYHVIGEAKFVKVKIAGGYSLVGEVIRKDPARDVALIKTESQPPLAISVRSNPGKVSEVVYAVGSPFGEALNGTITRGIISAVRAMQGINFLQSDVAVNPGNSGGPLLDDAGEIIAITNLKMEGASGIALFIPIEEALSAVGIGLK